MALAGILALAAILRIAAANLYPNIIFPDEIHQIVEPAHRLVFGNGIVAWEWVIHMRSWIFPGAIAAALWLGHFWSSRPPMEFLSVQLFMIGFSLIPVGAAYRWGRHFGGTRGGIVAGGFAALWVDLIYIASHPLSDVIASDILTAGLYAALPLSLRPGPVRLAIAGALFGITMVLRVQMAPALLVAGMFACGRSPKAWGAIILGGAVPIFASGCLDWITLGTPFQSIWLNIWLNIFEGISNSFGAEPASFFAHAFWDEWQLALFVVGIQILIGARRFPALLAVALAIIATQSMIAHKEWRFIFPALPLLVTLCGIAAIDEIEMLRSLFPGRRSFALTPAIVLLGAWAAISLLVALGPIYKKQWINGRDFINAFALISNKPRLCGVELVNARWVDTPGSAALPPGVPIYTNRAADAQHDAPGYDAAVSDAAVAMPYPYRRQACFAGNPDIHGAPRRRECVWFRDGGCTTGIAKNPDPGWPGFFRNKDGTPRMDRIRTYSDWTG